MANNAVFAKHNQIGLLLGICFWREGRGNRGLAEYMGEKGGCYSDPDFDWCQP